MQYDACVWVVSRTCTVLGNRNSHVGDYSLCDIWIRVTLGALCWKISRKTYLHSINISKKSDNALNKYLTTIHFVREMCTQVCEDIIIKIWDNSLSPSDIIWRHRSVSTLVQVMDCCLAGPNHNLNRFWYIINEAHWHLARGNFTRDPSVIND